MIFYHPLYSALQLPERHRFPIKKYQKLESTIHAMGFSDRVFEPKPASLAQIKLCHDADYVDAFVNGFLSEKAIKKMGFPWSTTLVERTLLSVGASIEAAEHALEHGLGLNLGGGYHHAQFDHGAGFCIFNDHAITAQHLIQQNLVERVVILDCDVHQGDGTADILHDNDNIITCSLHCAQNFPRAKACSDLDFELEKGCTDAQYLQTLQQALDLIKRLYRPDIIIYNAGADIYHKDELGLLDISLAGVLERDRTVISFCKNNGIPLSIGLGGGYQRNEEQLIEVHKQLLLAVFENY